MVWAWGPGGAGPALCRLYSFDGLVEGFWCGPEVVGALLQFGFGIGIEVEVVVLEDLVFVGVGGQGLALSVYNVYHLCLATKGIPRDPADFPRVLLPF